MQSEVSDKLQAYYDDHYSSKQTQDWYLAGGRGKARNIMAIAQGLELQTVLDIGSGNGSVLYWLDQWDWSPDITALEISESGIEGLKSRGLKNVKHIQQFDGYKIPFPDNSFDLVTCSHVIEHVEHYRLLLREIKRVSKYQIFEIPINFSLYVDKKVEHFLSYGHINIYTPQTFRFLLKAEGFSVLKSKGNLYDPAVYDMIAQNKFLKKWKLRIKIFFWKNSPLMWIKPHVLTVLSSSDNT